VARQNFEEILQHFQSQKDLLAGVGMDVCEYMLKWQRAILEDRCHHTVVWEKYCRKLTFRDCRPCPFLCWWECV